MSVDLLVPTVRQMLAVSSSYDEETIPDLIRRTITRLLRDYNFPKAVQEEVFTNLFLDTKEFTLPDGFKRELEFRIYDPTTESWTDPLRKRQGFQLPYASGYPYYYWLQGTKLIIDTAFPADMVGFSAYLWYQSMSATVNEDWLTEDFPDAVIYASVVRGAAEMRKPEVMQAFAPLWTDEQTSLAIYLNELEWNNSDIRMREARGYPDERYPAS